MHVSYKHMQKVNRNQSPKALRPIFQPCAKLCVCIIVQVVIEAERRCRQELQAMRERHRVRFMEATAKLRSQYKNLAKRARALETQLTKNSVSTRCLCMLCTCIVSLHVRVFPSLYIIVHIHVRVHVKDSNPMSIGCYDGT